MYAIRIPRLARHGLNDLARYAGWLPTVLILTLMGILPVRSLVEANLVDVEGEVSRRAVDAEFQNQGTFVR